MKGVAVPVGSATSLSARGAVKGTKGLVEAARLPNVKTTSGLVVSEMSFGKAEPKDRVSTPTYVEYKDFCSWSFPAAQSEWPLAS